MISYIQTSTYLTPASTRTRVNHTKKLRQISSKSDLDAFKLSFFPWIFFAGHCGWVLWLGNFPLLYFKLQQLESEFFRSCVDWVTIPRGKYYSRIGLITQWRTMQAADILTFFCLSIIYFLSFLYFPLALSYRHSDIVYTPVFSPLTHAWVTLKL